MSALLILKLLFPIARDLAKATGKQSDEGKKVTREEIEQILIDNLPDLAESLFKHLGQRQR